MFANQPEYDLIRRPDHIARAWRAIETALPKYWENFVQSNRRENPIAQLAAKYGKRSKPEPEGEVLARVFGQAAVSYEKEAQKYRRFFHRDAWEEFYDDPNAFKHGLSKDVPVIANTLHQRSAELKEWQTYFRAARAKDLLTVFSNVRYFLDDWSKDHSADHYAKLDEVDSFGLDPIDGDESMSMPKVIGMGIKSITLYHLDPERLPRRGRNDVYALYFLSGRDHFGLPSNSSEFLMVDPESPADDGSIIMEYNFWYHYGLFSLYALRVFRWMDQRASNVGFTLDHSVRYTYVQRFFEAVCAQHLDDLKTMRAYERFEVR